MKKLHFKVIAVVALLFFVTQASIGQEKGTQWLKKNARVELSQLQTEVTMPETATNENFVVNVEQVPVEQKLVIKSTEEVGEYGDDSLLYLILLCCLLGVPVVLVVSA